MTAANFPASLAFIWGVGRDNPADGAHATPQDPGGLTFGGVTAATWADCVHKGIVPPGRLADATLTQLTTICRSVYWADLCDRLPPGLDLLVFNGRYMTGHFPTLVQQCLGFMGLDDCDNWIGPQTIMAIARADPDTLIRAISGSHCAYLAGLPTWKTFGHGWTTRLQAAQAAALALADGAPMV